MAQIFISSIFIVFNKDVLEVGFFGVDCCSRGQIKSIQPDLAFNKIWMEFELLSLAKSKVCNVWMAIYNVVFKLSSLSVNVINQQI